MIVTSDCALQSAVLIDELTLLSNQSLSCNVEYMTLVGEAHEMIQHISMKIDHFPQFFYNFAAFQKGQRSQFARSKSCGAALDKRQIAVR